MNDERPIEKLLHRYAKKRRDDVGAPVELHPATRRLLQGEVARQFPKRSSAGDGEATTFARVLKLWRRQLLWALPVLIVLGVGVWVLVGTNEKSSREFELAKNTSASTALAETIERSFKALETPPPVSPASPSSLADQVTLAYTDGIPARDRRESSGVPAGSHGDNLGAALNGEALRQNRGDVTTVNGLSAISDKATGLKLETARVAAKDFVQVDELRNQPVAAKRALVEEHSAFGNEKIQTKGLAFSASAKADSVENFDSIRKDYISANKGSLASAPASKPAVLAPDASAKSFRQEARGGEQNKIQANSQAFANRAPASSDGKAAKSGGIVPVLANFQVEQTGDQLRVIDGDGSTYLGEMNLASAGQIVTVALEKKGAVELKSKREGKFAAGRLGVTQLPEQQSAQNFACRVSGTNRTLNQRVVFTWNFVALTNELAAAQVKLPAGGGNVLQNNLPAQQLPLLLNNSVINGRAQLGTAKEIEINAVPVPP